MINKDKMQAHPAIKVSQNKIYIYEAPNNLDTQGYLKIGQTERSSEGRILSQTSTAMVRANILAEYEAVDDNGQVFSDKEIHQFLLRKGIENLKHYESGKNSEWFRISLEDIKNVIENRQHFIDDFKFFKGESTKIELYPSQQEAIDRTYSRWLIAQQNPDTTDSNIRKFLWNAKPRFGKTLTAYKFAEKIKAKNVLVMTQRTSISNAWFSDYHEHIRNSTDSDYEFGSSKDNKIENEETVKARALNEIESARVAHDKNKSLIYYTTLANIKGKDEAGEFKKKNEWIFSAHWDLVILDETHEGTTTNPMYKVLETLNHDFLLELSGTPFRKMSESHGYTAKNTYSWSYIEEQEAKENWDYSKGKNPYINLPKLNIYTFQVPASVRVESDLSEYSFDFNEFWKVHAGVFVHNEEVDNFLDILSNQKDRHDDPQTQYYPFADNDTREQLRHTFWKLPSTAAVKLLAEKLRQHAFFKDYTVIEAAGSSNGQNSMKAEKEVKVAIGENGLNTKTITLSVDMLTTGTTVKEWTAVLMLDNSTSASKYIQTAFRAQTPWSVETENSQIFTKTNAFIFDFNPDRVLKVAEEYANIDIETNVEIVGNSTAERETKTQALLNFLPVIAMDEDGDMRYLDAKDAMNIINYTHARKIVDEGFMSNSLFNIKALFRMKGENYQRIRDIMDEIPPVAAIDKRKNTKKQGEPLADENPEDTFEMEKEKVISESDLGEKKFAAIETAAEQAGDDLDLVIKTVKEQTGEDITLEDIKKFEEVKKPYDEAKNKRKTEEEKLRDHLRGFARTIPVLLMAYAHQQMTFQDFEKNIPAADFLQVTGITRNKFRELRETRDESGEPVFIESAFNSAIHEFLKRKRATEHYYTGENSDDIYDYIPSQENNRVFTPKRVVNMMLDTLEAENPAFFKSDKVKLLDPYVKSGNFLAEAAKRFYKYSKDKDIHRIIENQLFGIAPFDIYATLAQETVYGFADTKFKNRLRNRNIRPEPQIHELMKENRLDEVIKEHFGYMKFDVVIGNPPYNDDAKQQLYTSFYVNAIKTADNVCMIFPVGWQEPKNANGLRRMNNSEIKHDSQIVQIDNRQNVFPGVTGAEWTNIVLWKRFYNNGLNGKQKVLTEGKNPQEVKLLIDKADKEKPAEIVELARIVETFPGFKSAQIITSVRKPYGLSTDVIAKPEKYGLPELTKNKNEILVYGKSGEKYYVSKDYPFPRISKGFDKYKVFVGYAWGNMLEKTWLGGAYSDVIVGEPLEVCIETYQEQGAFNTKKEAVYQAKYIMTKFARALLYKNKHSQHSTTAWGSVPIQDFSEPWWDLSIKEIDQKLMEKYNIPDNIQKFVFENIQERSEENIINF